MKRSVISFSCKPPRLLVIDENFPHDLTVELSTRNIWKHNVISVSKIRKIFTGPTHKLLLSFTVISDVYRFTKFCLTQRILKLFGRFEIHWVRQHPVNFTGLAGGHSKRNCLQDQANFYRSWAWQTVLIFNTVIYSQNLGYSNSALWSHCADP